MIPLRIAVRGFLCYREEQEICFDSAALWMLAGLNGSGKSAVFDGMTYALFGGHRAGKEHAEELINKSCDRAAVELDYQVAVERINQGHEGRDIIAVAHGGTIKAAVGLALGNQPERGLAFTIDNCSVTRLDHFASAGHANWRLPMVNQQPWIADIRHAAMHQPAGPEVVPETKLA